MNREDLKNYKYNDEWIKGRLEYIKEYKSTINKLIAVISDTPKGSRTVQDNEANKASKLLDYTNELYEYIKKQQDKQKQIIEQLNKVEQPYRVILDKVYIQGKSLVTTASEMGYSYVDICRKHGTALKKFDEMI